MPYDEVMPQFKRGTLHSGSKKGPKVTNPKQAVAIMMSEKKKAGEGKKEYKAYDDGGDVSKPAPPPPTPPPPPSAKPAHPPMPPKPSAASAPKIDVLPGAADTKVDIPQMVAAKKGGVMKHNKGGEVCPSNVKQMKQNIMETEVNPTSKVGLEKDGYVKPSWRRW